MASNREAFVWVEIESFRGFNDRTRVDLDASAIIVTGSNGAGKTSFFDAIQWLLLGDLERFRPLRARRTDDYVKNLYSGNRAAAVSAEVSLGGDVVLLRRQQVGRESTLTWTDSTETLSGPAAEHRLATVVSGTSGLGPADLVKSSALLEQDANQSVLQKSPTERYNTLASLLGLNHVTGFEAAAKERADKLAAAAKDATRVFDLAQARREEHVQHVRALQAEQDAREKVAPLRRTIVERMSSVNGIARIRRVPSDRAEVAFLQHAARLFGTELNELLEHLSSLKARAATTQAVPVETVRDLQTEERAAESAVAAAREKSEAAQLALRTAQERSSRVTALASQALDLLGDHCPVCQQPIDSAHVEHHLRENLAAGPDPGLADLVTAAAQAREGVLTGERALSEIRARLNPQLAAYREAEQLDAARKAWAAQASGFASASASAIEFAELEAIRSGEEGSMRRAREALRTLWTAATELLATFETQPTEGALSKAKDALGLATSAVAAAKEQAAAASQRAEVAKTLRSAATRAIAGVAEQRFRQLAPTIRDIYERLSPHPRFTGLTMDLDVYNGRGTSRAAALDVQADLPADPLLHFSSAQVNVTALSYFLALGWAAGAAALPFIFLDDPVQSMDDINALGFADLCRHIRGDRQLMVSTHDRRLAGLLERKLTPRTDGEATVVLRFGAWTSDGPHIEHHRLDSQASAGHRRVIAEQEAA